MTASRKHGGTDAMTGSKLIATHPTTPDDGVPELDVHARAATSIRAFSGSFPWSPGFERLIDGLATRAEALSRGEVAHAEGMLLAQAYTLDALFHDLLINARENKGSERADLSMRLALRVQAQCRATLDTLLARTAPPMVIARQANVTSGPQQINNTLAVDYRQNELLEQTHGERLDPGTTGQAGGSDLAMATVEAIDRPANLGR